MYNRDYFLKLVQQFAQVLARISGLKEKGEQEKAAELIRDTYSGLLKLERSYLLELEEAQLISTLRELHRLEYDQLEVLARLMYEDAGLDTAQKNNLCQKALLILQYLNTEQRVYSFEREQLMENIRMFADKG